MPLPRSSIVRLLSDQYGEQGVGPDTIGVIVEVDGDEKYDVDFSRADANAERNGESRIVTVPQSAVELMAKPGQLRTDPPVG